VNKTRAALLDVGSVVMFILVGRQTHDQGNVIAGFLVTAAPFLIGLAVSSGGITLLAWDVWSLKAGLVVWASTWIVGLAIRAIVYSEGVAIPFVIVAGVFLAATLLGWRAVVRLAQRPT